MTMSASSLALFAAALGGACAVPGPSVTAVIARALSQGLPAALPFCLGLVLGDLAWCGLSMFGAGAVFAQAPSLATALRYTGAAYLLWIAWELWCATPAVARDANALGVGRSTIDGLAVALSNPKTMLFYVALLPAIVDLDAVAPADFALPALVIAVVCGSVLCAYAVASARLRGRLDPQRQLRHIRRISGAVIALGALLIVTR